jgi:hypothetical protein
MAVCILAAIVFIPLSPVFGGRLVVSSLPYTVTHSHHSTDVWDTLTISGTKLVSSTDGLIFQATYNWFVDLGQDTIVFGRGGSSAQWGSVGIDFRPYAYDGCHDIIINDGYIINEPLGIDTLNYDPSDTLSGRCNGILMGFASHNLTIDGTFIRMAAYSSHGIRAGGYHSQYIKNVTIDHAGPGFHNRGNFDACAIKGTGFKPNEIGGDVEYHVKVENVKVIRCPHAGFYFNSDQLGSNYVVGHIEACTLTVDSRNIMYYPTGDGQTEHGRANCYGIQFTAAGPGTYIKNCRINAGESHHGGRGIQFVVAMGVPENPVVVCSNYVDVHEAADVAFVAENGYFPCAVKIRQSCRGMHLFDNTFIYTADGSIPWGTVSGSYYRAGHSFVYQHWTWSPSPPYNITVENNLIRAVDRNAGGGALIDAVCYDLTTGYDPSFVWRYNRVESDYVGYRWGGYDGEANSTVIVGDTLRLVDTSNSNHHAYQLGYLGMDYDANDIVACDMTYESGTGQPADYDSDVYFPSTRGVCDITLRRTLHIYVKGNNDLPVTNAGVTVTNNYGQIVLSGSTNNGGRLSGLVSYLYESRAGTDSTTYNDFTVNAYKSNDNAQITLTVDWDNFKDTLTLNNTAGDGEWEPDTVMGADNVPPADVRDLGAVYGDEDGSIELTWSVPGDDGSLGRAHHYVIRYSRDSITEASWPSATPVTDPPPPADPVFQDTQDYTISGLLPGHYYYIAVKTYDDAGNESDLSNVTGSFARGIAAPETDSVHVNQESNTATLYVQKVNSYLSVYYEFGLDINSSFTDPEIIGGTSSERQAYATCDGLVQNTYYYWRSRAVAEDQSDTSAWSSADYFMIVNFATSEDEFSPLAPTGNVSLSTSYPTLVVSNIDENPNIYRFEVSADSSFSGEFAALSPVIPQEPGDQTVWKVDSPLAAGRYFWRAEANALNHSETASFVVMPRLHAYPNPARFSEMAHVTFTEVPVGAVLSLTAVSGSIVRRWTNTDGSDITWDGTNESGQMVASGVYPWFLEGTDVGGKLVVIR